MYEMDMRSYDPATARWVAQDPVIHFEYSPYSAFDNNPVYFADPSGADSGVRGLGRGRRADNIQTYNFAMSADDVADAEGRSVKTTNGFTAALAFQEAMVPTGYSSNTTDCCGNKKWKDMTPSERLAAAKNMSAGALQGLAYSMPTGGYNAAMRGGDAWNPSKADIAGAEAAPGQFAMLIGGEYAFAKLFQGLVRLYRATFVARTSGLVAKGLGSTGRITANNLIEQMAMKAVVKDPTIGRVVMTGMKDSRWLGWRKLQYSVTTQNGTKAVIHYVGKFENGVLKYVDDFKFK